MSKAHLLQRRLEIEGEKVSVSVSVRVRACVCVDAGLGGARAPLSGVGFRPWLAPTLPQGQGALAFSFW